MKRRANALLTAWTSPDMFKGAQGDQSEITASQATNQRAAALQHHQPSHPFLRERHFCRLLC